MPAAAATIVAKSWLAHARVLADSFRRRHPDLPFFVLLADEAEGCFDPAAERFECVGLADLAISRPERFRFRHAQQELSYAATPFLIAHLLDRGFDRILFLKQETLVVGDLGPIFDRLAQRPILLTPHLLAPLSGADAVAREVNILLSGVYNVGMLGVAEAPVARRFLAWWGERTAAGCRQAVAGGLHYEQRWLDLVPGWFPEAEIVRDPGANVGHWNLPERRVEVDGDDVRVDGCPGRIVRFSGHDPARPHQLTRHSARLSAAEAGPVAELFERYRLALDAAGHAGISAWPYAFGCFDDGVAIPDLARELYSSLDDADLERFGDPFAAAPAGSFRRFLEEPVDGVADPTLRLNRFWRAVYDRRPDVRQAFPDLEGAHRRAFLDWTVRSGLSEHGAPAELLGHREP